jgi:hypothetical protein
MTSTLSCESPAPPAPRYPPVHLMTAFFCLLALIFPPPTAPASSTETPGVSGTWTVACAPIDDSLAWSRGGPECPPDAPENSILPEEEEDEDDDDDPASHTLPRFSAERLTDLIRFDSRSPALPHPRSDPSAPRSPPPLPPLS